MTTWDTIRGKKSVRVGRQCGVTTPFQSHLSCGTKLPSSLTLTRPICSLSVIHRPNLVPLMSFLTLRWASPLFDPSCPGLSPTGHWQPPGDRDKMFWRLLWSGYSVLNKPWRTHLLLVKIPNYQVTGFSLNPAKPMNWDLRTLSTSQVPSSHSTHMNNDGRECIEKKSPLRSCVFIDLYLGGQKTTKTGPSQSRWALVC